MNILDLLNLSSAFLSPNFLNSKASTDLVFNVFKEFKINPINKSDFIIDRPRLESELILCHVLKCDRSYLHLKSTLVLAKDTIKTFLTLIAERKNATPLEYLTKRASFFGLNFFVNEGVLIPRSETEILVQKALSLIETHSIKNCIEIGVGSGAISLSILKNTKQDLNIIACDISPEALEVAQINAKNLAVKNISFIKSDLLQNINKISENTLLISNPPYIANNYPLDCCVKKEPNIALFGGENGDEILKNLIYQAHNKNIKFLICEIGYDQKESLEKELNNYNFKHVFYKDLSGFNRGFVAQRI